MTTSPGRGSAADFLAIQRLAMSSMVLSVTRRCPLSCPHCITSSGPDPAFGLLSVSTAARWADELPALQAAGLRHLTFTGGEPVLALKAVAALVQAASQVGIRTAVVSSGAWASTSRTARQIAETLQRTDHWDLSYDAYHAAAETWALFCRAIDALEAVGASYSVRMCETTDPVLNDQLLKQVREKVGHERLIMAQRVRQIGRAETPGHSMPQGPTLPTRPCPTTGIYIREDGSTGPCCAGLAYEAMGHHPFEYGNAAREGLLTVWNRWHEDQLLRLFRLAGLMPILHLIDDPGAAELLSEDVCESCVRLWKRAPRDLQALHDWSAQPAVKQKLDDLERTLYGVTWEEFNPAVPQ